MNLKDIVVAYVHKLYPCTDGLYDYGVLGKLKNDVEWSAVLINPEGIDTGSLAAVPDFSRVVIQYSLTDERIAFAISPDNLEITIQPPPVLRRVSGLFPSEGDYFRPPSLIIMHQSDYKQHLELVKAALTSYLPGNETHLLLPSLF